MLRLLSSSSFFSRSVSRSADKGEDNKEEQRDFGEKCAAVTDNKTRRNAEKERGTAFGRRAEETSGEQRGDG